MPQLTIQQAFELATRLALSDRLAEAEQLFHQIIARQPRSAEARYNLARVLADKGDPQGALASYREALRLKPEFPEAMSNLGELLRASGNAKEAIELLQQAISLRPDFVEAHYNLGLALADADRISEAVAQMRSVIQLRPNSAEAYNQLGNLLREQDDLPEAMVAYRRAIAIRADFPEARWHLALALLVQGNFQEGWEQYESRRHIRGVWRDPGFTQSMWDGGSMVGRTLLLWAEQGFGDTIQFVRYVPQIQDGGGRVIVLCQPELQRLLASQDGIERAVSFGQTLPAFDVQCPMLSLPRIFRTTFDMVPNAMPYLRADPALAAKWKSRMPTDRMNVGVVWATRPAVPGSEKRSMGLHALTPLAGIAGVRFWSLQKGDAAVEARTSTANFDLVDCSGELSDFADTAALVANLDLVIACDTAVAHLAGAMGVPTRLALPFVAPWRWLRGRDDSPWYPTVRLFRQVRPGDWTTPVEAIARELRTASIALAGRR